MHGLHEHPRRENVVGLHERRSVTELGMLMTMKNG